MTYNVFKQTALTNLDAYKLGHADQYAEGTSFVFSNFTPRSDRLFSGKNSPYWDKKIVVAGIRILVEEIGQLWQETFFDRPKEDVLAEFDEICSPFTGGAGVESMKNRLGKLHNLGYLPIVITGLPEGSVVKPGVPVLFIWNTHADFYFLPNFLESWLSDELWKIMTSATTARLYRKILNAYVEETGANVAFADWQIHDFSLRGHGGIVDAAKSGVGHIMFSMGSDSIPAAKMIRDVYGDAPMTIAGSVPASEHATASSNIILNTRGGKNTQLEAEIEFVKRYITQIYPTGVCSYVSDTYDYWGVLTEVLPACKEEILNRKENAYGLAKVVARPDCYADGTKIFTSTGWLDFSLVTEDTLVAQVLDDGSYEFVKPSKIVNQPYDGKMVRFYDGIGKCDFTVTPNHRMISTIKGTERIDLAEDLKVGNWYRKFTRTASAKEQGTSLTNLERLKIAFQADGSYCSEIESKIRFSFSKQRKIDRLKNLLVDMDLPFIVYDLADGRKEIHIALNSSWVSKNFEWVDYKNLSKQWCIEFIEELSYWDSCRRSDSRFKFDSTNKRVIDIVELICIGAGYGVLVSEYEDNRKEIFNTVYTCNIRKDNQIGGQAIKKEVIDYSGNVYCVTVPTGRVLVKNNRATLVCGNSGDPIRIICGYREDEVFDGLTPVEIQGSIEVLWDIFGGTVNELGYKTLNKRIGLIYGDSITIERATEILERLKQKGFAADNIVFGVGSYTYQYVTRDTFGFAMKATYTEVNDEKINIFKAPKTDNGTKNSAKGLLRVAKDEFGEYMLLQEQPIARQDETIVYFSDSNILNREPFAEVRARALSTI